MVLVGKVSKLGALREYRFVDDDLPVFEGLRPHESTGVLRSCRCQREICAPLNNNNSNNYNISIFYIAHSPSPEIQINAPTMKIKICIQTKRWISR